MAMLAELLVVIIQSDFILHNRTFNLHPAATCGLSMPAVSWIVIVTTSFYTALFTLEGYLKAFPTLLPLVTGP